MSLKTCVAALLVFSCAGSTGRAQDWARKMFKTTDHDFGVVARGAKAEFAFEFENIYVEDVHVQGLRTTCGCTTTKFPSEIIKTYEKGRIVVGVDTRGFVGRKDSTITVVFDQPYSAEVALHIHSYIRSDIVFQPGSIDFGSIRQGQGAQQRTVISYAGRDNWQITGVESPSPHLTTELKELQRDVSSTTRVTYELTVDLKPDAPEGYLTEYLILRTNDADAKKSRVPLAVQGVVVAPLSVRPTALAFLANSGEAPPAQRLVVQGYVPFRVVEVTCADARLTCPTPSETRKVHVLPVTFDPGQAPGKTDASIRIRTDMGGAVLEVPVRLEVVPQKPETPGT